MERDTSILIGRAGQYRAGKSPRELFQGREPSFGFAEHLQRHGGLEAFFEQALMGRRVVDLQKRLMGLFQLGGRLR